MTPLASSILKIVTAVDYRPLRASQLAQELGLQKSELSDLRSTLIELAEMGRIRVQPNGLIRAKVASDLISGRIRKAQGGFGFLIQDQVADAERQDIFIPPPDLRDAQTGDRVLIQLSKRVGRFGLPQGRVVEIVERASNTFVGTYFERGQKSYVQVDGTVFGEPIYVGDPGAKGAQPKDKVVIEMLRFPSYNQAGEAVLIQVLGPRGQPGVDTLSIIYQYGIPDQFPDSVLEEARVQAQQFEEYQAQEITRRINRTQETIITIDPVDARDFDDAISLERSDDGHWHLGVHIADVSHFVPVGSALDKEAQLRGTSVYLPDRVIPMLPEILSNGLASLQAGEPRFVVTAQMEFTEAGALIDVEFQTAVIQVTQRFAYEQVAEFLQHPRKTGQDWPEDVRKLLQRMRELAQIFRRRRFDAGALELTLPEVKIDLDKEGKVAGGHFVIHDESHQIIEEFMLAANFAVAHGLSERGVPFLRRVHDEPEEFKMRKFSQFVSTLGFVLPKFQSRKDLQALLHEADATPFGHAVNYALLRSLKQAKYSPADEGHYALAAEDYCHFTSPIRRYPDLTIHRLIKALPKKGKPKRYLDEETLVQLGEHCSFTERRAESAERDLVKVKLLTYLKEHIGAEIDAVVTRVEDFGMFCQGVELPADGLLHITALGHDLFDYDETAQTLTGRRSGRSYRLGEKLRVVVAHVDVEKRHLDFQLPGKSRTPAATASPVFPKSKEAKRPDRDKSPKRGKSKKSKSGKKKQKKRR